MGEPPIWQHPPATPTLFPNTVPEVLLFSLRSSGTFHAYLRMTGAGKVQGSPVVLATAYLNQPLWMPTPGCDVPALPGFSELDSTVQDLVQ